jgi:hypothetical protein
MSDRPRHQQVQMDQSRFASKQGTGRSEKHYQHPVFLFVRVF